jgi:hypothetical protein
MSPKSIKLRDLAIPEEKKLHTTSDNPINVSIKKPNSPKDIFTVTKANTYDEKLADERYIATGAEVSTGKIFLTLDDYKESLNDPMIKKARTLAYIHEFLFDLAYVPFIKNPFKDYNGLPLYRI